MISKVVQKKSNMTADPSSYGMTDTMGRMHSVILSAAKDLLQNTLQRHPFEGVSFLSAALSSTIEKTRKNGVLSVKGRNLRTERPSHAQCIACFRRTADGQADT